MEERGVGGGWRVAMADVSLSQKFSLLFLGTLREFGCTEVLGVGALGAERLELYQGALGMGSRGFLGFGSLAFTVTLFLGTVLLVSTR